MPVTIICIEPHYSVAGTNSETFWTSETKLEKPKYCSALKCIETDISYCKVKKHVEEKEYLIPLCWIHGACGRTSEIYDYHLAALNG